MKRQYGSRFVVTDSAQLEQVVRYFLNRPAFVFDVETMPPDEQAESATRGEPTENIVVWIALATDGMTVVIPMGHPNGNRLVRKATRRKNKITGKFDMLPAIYDDPPEQLTPSEVFEALEPLFFDPDRIAIAHNAPFDFCSVAKYFGGRIPTCQKQDTIVVRWLLNENMHSYKLKPMIERDFGVKYDQSDVGKKIEVHSFRDVAHYAFMDARYEWVIWKRYAPLIKDAGLTEVFEVECELLDVLISMRLAGVYVDIDTIYALREELTAEVERLEAEVYRAAGQRFNMNSAPQKQHILYDPPSEGGQGLKPRKRTPKGAPSTDADSLEAYLGKNKVVDALAEYAEVNKILGTYIIGYTGVDGDDKKPCRIYDGRIHADLKQYGTVSGRFSCAEPNLQNIPRPDTKLGKKIRGLFIAPPGYKMVVADYGQIEMVLLAHFAGPGPLYHGIHAGMDPHSATAAALNGIPVEEFMRRKKEGDPAISAMRQVAKGINFAIVYGAGPDKVARMAEITVAEAKRFLEKHREMFPEVYRFKQKVISVTRSRKPPHIRTLLGRKRRLPAIYARDQAARGEAERQAVNSLIQGSAADIIKLAMIRLHKALPDDMQLVLSVHDELGILCPEEKAEECAEILREAMLGEGITGLINVPLTADVKIVDRWSDAKE